MIYIKKSKNHQFYVDVTGKNNEKLSSTETFKTKQSAWKNIYAQALQFNSDSGLWFLVTDLSMKKETSYHVIKMGDKKFIKEKLPL